MLVWWYGDGALGYGSLIIVHKNVRIMLQNCFDSLVCGGLVGVVRKRVVMYASFQPSRTGME